MDEESQRRVILSCSLTLAWDYFITEKHQQSFGSAGEEGGQVEEQEDLGTLG